MFVTLLKAFVDGLASDRWRALRLYITGLASTWLALIGLRIYLLWPVMASQWSDQFTGQPATLSNLIVEFAVETTAVFLVALYGATGIAPYLSRRSARAFGIALPGAVAAGDPALTRARAARGPAGRARRASHRGLAPAVA